MVKFLLLFLIMANPGADVQLEGDRIVIEHPDGKVVEVQIEGERPAIVEQESE